MNRFFWVDPGNAKDMLRPENVLARQPGVRLYDGEEKTPFDKGHLILSSTSLLWIDDQEQTCMLGLGLSLVVLLEDQRTGTGRSPKILLHLSTPPENHVGVQVSTFDHVKLSFREGGMMELQLKLWDIPGTAGVPTVKTSSNQGPKPFRAGIAGIERNLQEQHKTVSSQISQAFADLSQLMKTAKDTVTLTKSLVSKVKSRQGEITADETVQLKSYLLSLGIDDPVTRDVCGNDSIYHQKLAREISELMLKPLKECGGIMTLTDVFCRVNRARGLELVSPEDLLKACKLMSSMNLPAKLKVFDSGVITLEARDLSDDEIVRRAKEELDVAPLTAEELAKKKGTSVILAREMLLLAESRGVACRDESVEGLRFFPNKFVEDVC